MPERMKPSKNGRDEQKSHGGYFPTCYKRRRLDNNCIVHDNDILLSNIISV
ncbi:hypothetical protein ISN45_At01g027050 [Arabidopsis thaliana x Arabidopsis arenosa]|uniref:Uncharacterized protein n=2 Tax=Arabidopsis TaxID=3701 RepID=A0A8T2H8F6_ARASU|nr:hypothetical protein ISN45_At01g027050 [Arabidopsis thaliana x Arabidopsis arenosa]KAG7655620.1 hypothetical protein ISN44_As01g026820 [Arabidopsis suecica]